MSEELHINATTKVEKYKELLPQVKALLEGEKNTIANMANFCAALKETFDWLWIGFYMVDQGELVLGPFQGPIACTRIAKGRGVCGTVYEKEELLIVPDVDAFPGHIACSSSSRSEIVIPLFDKKNEVFAVLDVDSDQLNEFDELDAENLKIMLQSIC